ncbi:uncharacterized protein L969DRAFT_93479 [Mixia osmundae IAM 14324]|uniref:PWWP domain-containing protein n=1 Tax=Mixia osmundae (strain CBS 9802 / IAM 14324 / JCM 22182 / KY 12970) TaxID=764103 RepID=G7DU34_MIXOS|nr:uncharacterized protein L969DRAFT_93479 [Mixia osmundae IAM 14324]KEI40961.1 hypothetical protein L969DRAFT_93479 [Mixia osmundae IAM 14324]GAA94094.1 hypothetical protein E5Q_00741 [Mixia osmundae IAM 14324]
MKKQVVYGKRPARRTIEPVLASPFKPARTDVKQLLNVSHLDEPGSDFTSSNEFNSERENVISPVAHLGRRTRPQSSVHNSVTATEAPKQVKRPRKPRASAPGCISPVKTNLTIDPLPRMHASKTCSPPESQQKPRKAKRRRLDADQDMLAAESAALLASSAAFQDTVTSPKLLNRARPGRLRTMARTVSAPQLTLSAASSGSRPARSFQRTQSIATVASDVTLVAEAYDEVAERVERKRKNGQVLDLPATAASSSQTLLPDTSQASRPDTGQSMPSESWNLNRFDDIVWVALCARSKESTTQTFWWPAEFVNPVRSARPLRLRLIHLQAEPDLRLPSLVTIAEPSSSNVRSFRTPFGPRFSTSTYVDKVSNTVCALQEATRLPSELAFAQALSAALDRDSVLNDDLPDPDFALTQAAAAPRSPRRSSLPPTARLGSNNDLPDAEQEPRLILKHDRGPDDELRIPGEAVYCRWNKHVSTCWPARVISYHPAPSQLLQVEQPTPQGTYALQSLDGKVARFRRDQFYTIYDDGFLTCEVGQYRPELQPIDWREEIAHFAAQLRDIVRGAYAPTRPDHDRFLNLGHVARQRMAEDQPTGKYAPKQIDQMRLELRKWLSDGSVDPTFGCERFRSLNEGERDDYIDAVFRPAFVRILLIETDKLEERAREELGNNASLDEIRIAAHEQARAQLEDDFWSDELMSTREQLLMMRHTIRAH